MSTSKSLRTYTKITLGTAAALTATSHSEAAIVFFDVIPDRLLDIGDLADFGSINLGTATYDSSTTAPSFTLSNSGGFLEGSGLSIDLAAVSGFYLQSFVYGYSISSLLDWGSPTFTGYVNDGDTRYLGLRMAVGGGNYNYGWASITGGLNGSSQSTFTINSFAFEGLINTTILAGDTGSAAVPEPGQVAASLLLLAGIAGYFALRRRAGAASEPNALHSLALGARGIEEFRKNKAA
jgi:hypothetical protein